MDANSESPAGLADVAGALNVALGTLTFQFFPFALPAIILVVGPLAVLAVAGLLLALPILLPLWLASRMLPALRRRRAPRAPAGPTQASRPARAVRTGLGS